LVNPNREVKPEERAVHEVFPHAPIEFFLLFDPNLVAIVSSEFEAARI
jgi:hypothetical protein